MLALSVISIYSETQDVIAEAAELFITSSYLTFIKTRSSSVCNPDACTNLLNLVIVLETVKLFTETNLNTKPCNHFSIRPNRKYLALPNTMSREVTSHESITLILTSQKTLWHLYVLVRWWVVDCCHVCNIMSAFDIADAAKWIAYSCSTHISSRQ